MSRFSETFFTKHSYHSIAIKLLQKGETVDITLTGHCMNPLLCENDIITVKPLSADRLRCGDIVLYQIDGRLKSHRFLRKIVVDGQRFLLTKSDRRYSIDQPVPVSDLLGKIIQVNKKGDVIDYESTNWHVINFALGVLSPYISLVERPIMWAIRFPSRVFRCVNKYSRTQVL